MSCQSSAVVKPKPVYGTTVKVGGKMNFGTSTGTKVKFGTPKIVRAR